MKHDGRYLLFGSDLTYWHMNDNKYAVASELAGPWSAWRDIAPAGSNTFESQVSVVVPVGGGFVYVGDRWTEHDLESSPLVMLPLRITDDRVVLLRKRAGEASVPIAILPESASAAADGEEALDLALESAGVGS